MYRLLYAGLLAVLFMGNAGVTKAQQNKEDYSRTVSVQGQGVVRVLPDQAEVRFGITIRGESPEEVRKESAERAKKALEFIRELGIADRHIRMNVLRLREVIERDPRTRKITYKGYEAIREFTVTVDDLEKVPELIAGIVQGGVNRLLGISYGLQDPVRVRNQALEKAARDAREKAQLLAQTLGAQLGQVISVSESNASFPQPVFERASMMMAKAVPDAVPEAYAAGEIEVRATVRVVFALK